MKDIIKTKDAKKGGYLVGKPHSQGGIKGINVDTNEPIEVEGGEVVITKPAVESQKTYQLDGVPMKPRDILSKINSDHGGVKFKDGGQIDNKFDDGGKLKDAKKDDGLESSTPMSTPSQPETESAQELDTPQKMINAVKKKDETDAIKYELLLEALEDEETKLVVLRAISKDNPIKLRDIDRKLDEIARKKGEYDLKKNTSLELLDKFEDVVQLTKYTDEEPSGESITGEPSQLTEYQRAVVNSPQFKSWFGDWQTAYELNDYNGVSKAVSPITREPLVLYHGTDTDFTKWTFDKFPAAYFADNWSYSEWFANAKSRGGGGQIYEVFISMKNPINLQSFGLNLVTMDDIFTYLENNYQIDRFNIFPQLTAIAQDPQKMAQAMNVRLQVWQFVRRSVNFIKYLKDETFYDGILMFEDNPDDMLEGNVPNSTGSYVAFFKQQIKWASAKFYNPAIDDNRFKHGGLIKYFSK